MQIVITCVNQSCVVVDPAAFGPRGTFAEMLLRLACVGRYDVNRRVGLIDYWALRSLRFCYEKNFESCAVVFRLMMIGKGELLAKAARQSVTVCLSLIPWHYDPRDDLVWWIKYAEGSACQVDPSMLPNDAVLIRPLSSPKTAKPLNKTLAPFGLTAR